MFITYCNRILVFFLKVSRYASPIPFSTKQQLSKSSVYNRMKIVLADLQGDVGLIYDLSYCCIFLHLAFCLPICKMIEVIPVHASFL